ncbi:MAG: hypothetical protein E7434_06060 [Ruminococcaceae bacterium]|nr:hypothetical protein [Oscillospiraceae bacterium]
MDLQTKALLQEDKLYDKKSLIFENDVLSQVEDANDDDRLPEGRLGEFPLLRFHTQMKVPLIVPLTKNSRTLKEAEVAEDSDCRFLLHSDNRYLCLEKLGTESMQWESLESNDEFIQKAENEWLGILETPYGKMLGTVNLLISADNTAVLLTYAGIGNYTDIQMEKNNIQAFVLRRINR